MVMNKVNVISGLAQLPRGHLTFVFSLGLAVIGVDSLVHD